MVFHNSVPEADFLRRLSPAGARLLEAMPGLVRFLERAPDPRGLRRVPVSQVPLVMRTLRRMRARVFVHTAWSELHGVSPLETGRLWSVFADEAIALADRTAWHELTTRYGMPRSESGSLVGRTVFGLGKLGTCELNPSSDVDLLFVYETDGGPGPRPLAA